ncbi:MAG: hypothetical protein IPH13_14635 [Planctomycetes bacterium]|nr:hypothetical protein [Planctomycetota bacterium]MCC7172074.1 hypothetical protein [Planctomycetota bacterium]
MRPRNFLRGLALAVAYALAATATAVAAEPTLTWADRHYPVPTTIDLTASWRGMAVGDFDGDRQPDCIVRCVPSGESDGTLVFMQAPDTYESISLLSSSITANDIATYAGGGPDGADALVSVGPSGLRSWRRSTTQSGYTSTVEVGSPLLDAQLVRAVRNAARQFDVVASDGLTVYRVTLSSSGNSVVQSFSQTSSIVDLELFDYDGSGDLDRAIVSPDGLRIRQADGTTTLAATGNGKFAAIVRHRGRTTDQVAFVTQDAGTSYFWCQVVGNGHLEAPIALGPIGVADVVSADLLGSGASELVVSHRASSWQVALPNVSTTTASSATFDQFTYQFVEIAPITVDFSTNDATPGIADFDNDGDLDCVLPCRPTASVYIGRNQLVSENEQRLFPRAGPGGLPQLSVYDYASEVRLQLSLSSPGVLPPTAEWDLIEVKAWWGQVGEAMVRDLIAHEVVAADFELSIAATLDILFESPWQPLAGDRLFLEVRPIEVNSDTGDYASVGPTTTIVVLGVDVDFDAYTGEFDELYLGTQSPPMAVPFTVIEESGLGFDSGDPSPYAAHEPDDSMSPPDATEDVRIVIVDVESGGWPIVVFGSKGGVNTGGASSPPNIDPFNPTVPPPDPPRRPPEGP